MLLLELMRSSVCSVSGRCDEATMKESIYVCGARKESTDELVDWDDSVEFVRHLVAAWPPRIRKSFPAEPTVLGRQ